MVCYRNYEKFLIIFFAEPSSTIPELLERATTEVCSPESADEIEHYEEGDCKEEAVTVTASVIECETPVVE